MNENPVRLTDHNWPSTDHAAHICASCHGNFDDAEAKRREMVVTHELA